MVQGVDPDGYTKGTLEALEAYDRGIRVDSSFARRLVKCEQSTRITWQRSSDGSICYVQHDIEDWTKVDFVVHSSASDVRGVGGRKWLVPIGHIIGRQDLCEATVDIAQDLVVISLRTPGTW